MIENILPLVDGMAIVLGQAAMLARARLAQHPSPVLRAQALRDADYADARLLEREAAVLRASRAALKPAQRPDFAPAQRLEILQIMRLRDWSPAEAAERFVLHPNTLRGWQRAMHAGKAGRLFAGVGAAWNRYHDAVRLGIQNLRDLFPESEFGTRTITAHLVRAGVQVGRSSVQRILREPKRPRPGRGQGLIPPEGRQPHGLLTPATPNQVWHVDLTTLRILWLRLTIAAVVDGCSRKVLSLKVYAKVPGTSNLLALLRGVMTKVGKPRFLISDHGGQFKKKFKAGLKDSGVTHVTGKVRCPAMNGKVERFFRTFRGWVRGAVLPWSIGAIQRRLDLYAHWYNHYRPHQSLGGRTPEEAWNGVELPKPIPLYARDAVEVEIDVGRRSHAGDRRMPIVDIAVAVRQRKAA